MVRLNGFAAYFLAGTLAFVTVDLAVGLNVRIPVLGTEPLRWAYYALLLGLGFMAGKFPSLAPWIGVGESLVNLFLTFLSVLLPIWSLSSALDQGIEPADAVMSLGELVGTALAGSVFLAGMYQALLQGRSDLGR